MLWFEEGKGVGPRGFQLPTQLFHSAQEGAAAQMAERHRPAAGGGVGTLLLSRPPCPGGRRSSPPAGHPAQLHRTDSNLPSGRRLRARTGPRRVCCDREHTLRAGDQLDSGDKVPRAPACSRVPSTRSEVRTCVQEAAASSLAFPGLSVLQVPGS